MPKGSKKIKPPDISKKSEIIKETRVHEPKISFSFEYLDSTNRKFSYQSCRSQYFLKLLEKLKIISGYTRKDISATGHHKSLRFHQIDFGNHRVSEENFGISGNLGEDAVADAWQFEITANKYGRVHGFFIDSVFYIRWFDPNHKLYPNRPR